MNPEGLKKKKKKKTVETMQDEEAAENKQVVDDTGDNLKERVKKKKKKVKDTDECPDSPIVNIDTKGDQKARKNKDKKKKKIEQKLHEEKEYCKVKSELNAIESANTQERSENGKSKKVCLDNSRENQFDSELNDQREKKKKKKKKKERQDCALEDEEMGNENNTESVLNELETSHSSSFDSSIPIVKKKKKKKIKESERNESESESGLMSSKGEGHRSEDVEKQRKKKRKKDANGILDNKNCCSTLKRKKNCDDNQNTENGIEMDCLKSSGDDGNKESISDDIRCENKKTKKKNKERNELEGGKKDKLKRKSSIKEETKDDLDCNGPKKRKKDKQKEQVQNNKAHSAASENANLSYQEPWKSPVFENEGRQQKFQRLLGGKNASKNKLSHSSLSSTPDCEISNEGSDPKKNLNGEETSSPALSAEAGQWQGVMFENAERQSKFLRLLGGAKSNSEKRKGLFASTASSGQKKGLFGSLTLSSLSGNGGESKTGGNIAMNLQSAAILNNNLENNFNQAINRRLDKVGAAGIGYVKDPAEGKKFHIDSNSTKSMKFSDDDE